MAMGENGLRNDGGGFASTLADIIALMVAGSSWAKLFFENSQDIGAVRKSATITEYQAFNDLTLHAPCSSAVRHNFFFHEMFGTFSSSLLGERV